ncbi:hypothetical protein K6T82_22020 [Flavobacterium sp. 17A]|uniref:Uncharacterized protein n=1 Tax=Flavobacterium potami TaxID=2872310 RepID=A0A9X1HDQ9_9FLAO|nr:hypothetical protein [Flavobacterium potami]MBZ4037454.1 hypothetical protein [Flavobacterium potami]
MNFKPGDLFFGLMEFLAYIVPGFIFCVTLPLFFNCRIDDFCDLKNNQTSTFGWVSLTLVSYIVGHFIHHLSAIILNPLYTVTYLKWRRKKHEYFITEMEKQINEKISISSGGPLEKAEAYIKVNNPTLIPELEKYQANSKLFRSLSLLCIYLCFIPNINWWARMLLIPISYLSYHKFANQRWNHRALIYQYFNLIN